MLPRARARWHHALPRWARRRPCGDSSVRRVVTKLLVEESQTVETGALRAVWAGLCMQKRLYSLPKEWAASRLELARMQIRVGVNTGEVVSGNIGSETRMDYTVVGDNVNVASQLESVSRAGAVCISEATYREIEGHIAATKLEPVYVKNRLQPVHVYTVQAAPDGEV